MEKRDRGVSSRLSHCEEEITAGCISESFLETGTFLLHSTWSVIVSKRAKPRSSGKGQM